MVDQLLCDSDTAKTIDILRLMTGLQSTSRPLTYGHLRYPAGITLARERGRASSPLRANIGRRRIWVMRSLVVRSRGIFGSLEQILADQLL